MSAKSLETFAIICARDEPHNSLLYSIMLWEGDMNNPAGRSDAFLYS